MRSKRIPLRRIIEILSFERKSPAPAAEGPERGGSRRVSRISKMFRLGLGEWVSEPFLTITLAPSDSGEVDSVRKSG